MIILRFLFYYRDSISIAIMKSPAIVTPTNYPSYPFGSRKNSGRKAKSNWKVLENLSTFVMYLRTSTSTQDLSEMYLKVHSK